MENTAEIFDMKKSMNDKIKKYEALISKLESKQYKNKVLEKIRLHRIRKYMSLIEIYNQDIADIDSVGIAKMKRNHSMRQSAKKRKMILSGDLFKTVLIICAPIALYNFFNSFYNLLDSIICASISSDSVSQVAALGQIKGCISALGGGLAAGGAIIVARHYGAGDLKKAKKNSSVLFLLGIIVSLIVIALLVPSARFIISLCQVANITDNTVNYFRLQLVELAFVTINTIFIGLEKAKGNTKQILLLNVMVLIVKLTLNVIFVYGMKVDNIMWIEFATILGQLTLFAVAIKTLFSKKNILKCSVREFSLRKEYVLPIIKISIPIFLGKFVMSLGKVVVNAICGFYYNITTDGLIVGALAVSNNLSGLVTSPTNAFEEGGSTIVSQNLGAKNMRRALKSFWKNLLIVAVVSAIGFVLVRFVFLDNLIDLFSKKTDMSGLTETEIMAELQKQESLKRYIKEIFVYDCLSIPALGLTASVLSLLYGFGKTALSSVLNFCRIGTRIIVLWICHDVFNMDYTAAGISMGISNIMIFVLAVVFLLIFYIDLKKKGYRGMHIDDPEPKMVELDLS